MTDISSYRHGRVPREVRRVQLVGLAQDLFAEHGFAGVSMEQLAAAAGITKPVVYEIFGSKDGLYEACISATADELSTLVADAVGAEPDMQGKIRVGARAFFAYVVEHRSAWRMMAAAGGRFAGAVDRIRAAQATLVAGLLDENARALGAVIDPRELEMAAHAVNAASEAMAAWAIEHPDFTPDVLADRLVALVAPGLLAMAAANTTQEHS